jgi:hypothetical protein
MNGNTRHMLIEVGRRCGVEMNVEKTKAARISRHLSPVKTILDKKQVENAEYANIVSEYRVNKWCKMST